LSTSGSEDMRVQG